MEGLCGIYLASFHYILKRIVLQHCLKIDFLKNNYQTFICFRFITKKCNTHKIPVYSKILHTENKTPVDETNRSYTVEGLEDSKQLAGLGRVQQKSRTCTPLVPELGIKEGVCGHWLLLSSLIAMAAFKRSGCIIHLLGIFK